MPPPDVQNFVAREASSTGSKEEVALAVQGNQAHQLYLLPHLWRLLRRYLWNALRLDTFDGLGTPVDAANWL